MSDTRRKPDREASRAERGEAALVAQYIHELSERHGADQGSGRAETGEDSRSEDG